MTLIIPICDLCAHRESLRDRFATDEEFERGELAWSKSCRMYPNRVPVEVRYEGRDCPKFKVRSLHEEANRKKQPKPIKTKKRMTKKPKEKNVHASGRQGRK